jgi:SAM-dependent methyltransferase
MNSTGATRDESVIWHDVECAVYAADLAHWGELAQAGQSILELGCGSGRVGLWLAQAGYPVTGLDTRPSLVEAFNQRARDLPAAAQVGNAAGFALNEEFGLVLAPMQLAQLLGGAEERDGCLKCVAGHLRPGGRLALAIVEGIPDTTAAEAALGARIHLPLPDTREIDGWAYSSLPLETVVDGERIVVRRLRQTVSPTGELSEELSEIELCALTAAGLEGEGVAAGLRPAGRREIPATEAHIGSTIVLLRKEG